jgi:hypothetical protein
MPLLYLYITFPYRFVGLPIILGLTIAHLLNILILTQINPVIILVSTVFIMPVLYYVFDGIIVSMTLAVTL